MPAEDPSHTHTHRHTNELSRFFQKKPNKQTTTLLFPLPLSSHPSASGTFSAAEMCSSSPSSDNYYKSRLNPHFLDRWGMSAHIWHSFRSVSLCGYICVCTCVCEYMCGESIKLKSGGNAAAMREIQIDNLAKTKRRQKIKNLTAT